MQNLKSKSVNTDAIQPRYLAAHYALNRGYTLASSRLNSIESLAFWLLSRLESDKFAGRVRDCSDLLYPVEGTFHPRYKRTRFFLRCLFYRQVTASWLGYLWSEPALLALLQAHPELAERPHRPYARADLNVHKRVSLLQHHYRFCLHHPLGKHLQVAMTRRHELAALEGKHGEKFRFILTHEGRTEKEGELTMQLEMDGQRIYMAAFTIGGDMNQPSILIGCMQGPDPHLGNNAVKLATKALHGWRPRNTIIDALQVLAAQFGISAIFGIGNRRHIYRHWRKPRNLALDYDTMWLDAGGQLEPDSDFSLPLTTILRSIEEYTSNKRAEAARRQTLQRTLQTSIIETLRTEILS